MENNLYACPFCGGKAKFYHRQEGNPVDRYYIYGIKCIQPGWIDSIKSIHQNGLTGSCGASIEESFRLVGESIEKVDQNLLKKIKELLTKRWNNRP